MLIVLGALLVLTSAAVVGYSLWSEQQHQAQQAPAVAPKETLPARLPIPTPRGKPGGTPAPAPAPTLSSPPSFGY